MAIRHKSGHGGLEDKISQYDTPHRPGYLRYHRRP